MENAFYQIPNILIVDDINANLVVLTELIRNSGYIARPVTSASQALKAIEMLEPHLIILDISMPDMNGFEFCTYLKKIVKTKDIPIIFISAMNSMEDRIKGFKCGAVDFIVKPFEVEEVTQRINTHLKIYMMQQELEIYNNKLYKIINSQIQKLYDEQKNTVNSLVKLLQLRTGKTKEHLENIGKNSKLLAMSLQLTPQYNEIITNCFIDNIEYAAPLYDIGYIGVKNRANTLLEELNNIPTADNGAHVIIGAEVLRDIYSINQHNEYIQMAIDIIMGHHEKWNGTGYPNGLKGNEIPLSARIVSIVIAYDAYISEVYYNQACFHEESIRKINKESGESYDPDILAVFNKIQYQLKQ